MKHPFKKFTTVVSAFLATFLFISTISFTSPFVGADAAISQGQTIYIRNDGGATGGWLKDGAKLKLNCQDTGGSWHSDFLSETVTITNSTDYVFKFTLPSDWNTPSIFQILRFNSSESEQWNDSNNVNATNASTNFFTLDSSIWSGGNVDEGAFKKSSANINKLTLTQTTGGTISCKVHLTDINVSSNSYVYSNHWFVLTAMPSNGYKFVKWQVNGNDFSSGGTNNPVTLEGTSGDCNFSAVFERNVFTVTLNDNGGQGGQGSVSATLNSLMPTLSSLPTKANYYFNGYYDDATSGTLYYNRDGSSAKNWDKSNDSTLYAHYLYLPENHYVSMGNGNYVLMTKSAGALPSGCIAQWEYSSILTQGDNVSFKADATSITPAIDTDGRTNYISGSGIRYSTFSEEYIYLKAYLNNNSITYSFYVGGISTERNAIVNDEFVKQMPLNTAAQETEYFCTGLKLNANDKVTVLNGGTNIIYSTSLRDDYSERDDRDFDNFTGGINGIQAKRTGYYDLYLNTSDKFWVNNNMPYYKDNYYWEEINSLEQINPDELDAKYYISVDASFEEKKFAEGFSNFPATNTIKATKFNEGNPSFYKVKSISQDPVGFSLADANGKDVRITKSKGFFTTNSDYPIAIFNFFVIGGKNYLEVENSDYHVYTTLIQDESGFKNFKEGSDDFIKAASRAVLYRPWAISDVTGVNLSDSSLELNYGDTETLLAEVVSNLGENVNVLQKVTWSSSSDSVATVDSDGKVTAVGEGECTITATSVQNPDVSAVCYVTVEKTVDIHAYVKENLTLGYRGYDNPIASYLEHSYTPDDLEDVVETFTSSDTSVAIVDSTTGRVTRVGVGNCVITYTVSCDGASDSDTCEVTVTDDRIMVYNKVTEIIAGHTYYFGNKEESSFVASYDTDRFNTSASGNMPFIAESFSGGFIFKNGSSYYYSTATQNAISTSEKKDTAKKHPWSLDSDNNYALFIHEKHLKFITADKTGAQTYLEGDPNTPNTPNLFLYEAVEQTVNVQITNKSSDTEDFEYTSTANTDQLTATSTKLFNPPETRSLTWSSSNTNIATVNESGLVSFTGENGSVTITVCDSEETWVSAKHTYNVTNVDAHIISVAIDTPSTTEIDVYESSSHHTLLLEAEVVSYGDIDDSVTWSSSDITKATVDPNTGLVTAVGVGTVTITATSNADNTKYDSIELTVVDNTPIVTSIAITTQPTKTTGYAVGNDVDLTGMVITVTYSDGSTAEKTYSSENPDPSITFSPTQISHIGTNIIKVTYTEHGVSKSENVLLYANYSIPDKRNDESRDSKRDINDYGYYEKVLYNETTINYSGRYLIVYEYEENNQKYAYVLDASLSSTDIKSAKNFVKSILISTDSTNDYIYTTTTDYFGYELQFDVITKDGRTCYSIMGNGPVDEDEYLIGCDPKRDPDPGLETYILKSESNDIRNDIIINSDNTLSIYANNGFALKFYDATSKDPEDAEKNKIFRFTGASGGQNKGIYLYQWHSYYNDAKEYADGFKNYFVECYSDEEQTNLVNYTKLVEKFKEANADFKLLNAGAQGYLKPIEESHTYVFEPAEGDDSKINQVKNRCAECMMSRYGLSLGMDDDDFETLKNSPLYKHYDFKIDDDSTVLLIIISSSSILLATSAALLFLLKKKKKQINK